MLPLLWIYWDPEPVAFTIPIVGIRVLWYGILFAFGFAAGFPIFVNILTRFLGKDQRQKAIEITDRLALYMIVGTVLGARVGHFLFYENPSSYLKDPLQIFRFWEPGLASHGAAIGIVIALVLFSIRIRPVTKKLNWIHLLDLVAIPTALAGACIRTGNFINQEVLGTVTNVPWAVVFGHPFDGSMPAPRHPAQLYEAFFYLLVFFILWRLSYKKSFLFERGKLIGLFLILVFGFRFLVEYLKVEQSPLISSYWTMGQFLSIPAIIAGLLLLDPIRLFRR